MFQLDVESLNVNYKYFSGEGVMCLCEFHNDTHPSMFVNLVEGNFYCFSCGFRGTVDTLIKETGGSKKYVPYNLNRKDKNNDEWLSLLSLSSAKDDKYLLNRGFTSESIEKFGLLSDEDRVIIPLQKDDKTIGVKIRIKKALKGVKYLTFGEQPTHISNFDIKCTDTPKNVIITEGFFGLMRYDMNGFNCITPLTVARGVGLKKLVEILKHNYYIAFDNDSAGFLGTAKLLYVTRVFNNITALRDVFDVDNYDLTKINFEDTVKSPEVFLGFVNDKFGVDNFIKVANEYRKFRDNYRG